MKKIFFAFGLILLPLLAANAESNKQTAPQQQTKTYVKHIDADGFRQYVWDYTQSPTVDYKGDLPCIVDFYTTWCGPCRRIAPIMEELAKEYDGKIHIYKVNTEEPNSVVLAQIFNIRSIPTLFYFPKNDAPQLSQGAMSKEQYKEIIETILLKNKTTAGVQK